MLANKTERQKQEDPRILRTRRLLVEALDELLREKSFESVTVSEIANRATLNRVTFYAHFQDKYALLEYSMRSLAHAKLHGQLDLAGPLTEAGLQKLVVLVCTLLAETAGHCPPPRQQMESLMEKQIRDEIYALLLGYLRAAKPAVRQTATPEQTAMIAAWAIYGAAYQWSQQAERQPVAKFASQVLPLIAANLAAYLYNENGKVEVRRPAAGRAPSSLLTHNFAH